MGFLTKARAGRMIAELLVITYVVAMVGMNAHQHGESLLVAVGAMWATGAVLAWAAITLEAGR